MFERLDPLTDRQRPHMQPLGGGRIEAARFHGRCQRGPPRRRRHDGHQRTGSAARPAAPDLTPTSSTTSPT